ncbi:MAG: CDP-diacylglycerol--glycerol-3-phosphate 3-phosphatidyltransferase [Mycoplasma sp.]|nr:CDP-diacylglycerol--glycerol-3-phosphate 3-phosphatidyltransferase [Mycoplasma sp.]
MTLANKFTIVRLILVIPFLIFLAIPLHNMDGIPTYKNWDINSTCFLIAFIIFSTAMITDYIDGQIARKTNTVTSFGKVFDPVADKIITNTALIMFAIYQVIPWWLVVVILMRDIIIDGVRSLSASNKKIIAASMMGKLKTVVISIGILFIFALSPLWTVDGNIAEYFPGQHGTPISEWGNWLINIPLLIGGFLSIYSGIQYVWNAKDLIKLK